MPHTSISRFGLILIAALAALAALLTAAIYLTRVSDPSTANALAKPVMAAQLEFLSGTIHRRAAQIAAHPQTVACFVSASPETCAGQGANLHALNPDARVLFVTTADRQLLPDFLAGGAQRLLVSGEGGPIARAAFNLSVSHPVTDEHGRRLGFVIVEQSLPQLQEMFDTLPLPDDAAYAELQQSQADGTIAVLMRRGNQAATRRDRPALVALAGTPWRVAVWRPAVPPGQRVAPYVLAWLASVFVIALLVSVVMAALRKRVHDNLRTLLKLINDVRHQRLRPAYPVTLVEFEAPVQTVWKLGKLMLGRQQEVTNEARIDHLSQVHNRRSFDEKQKELFASVKQGWAHSLLIIDIDNFKQVNDTFGHEAGDQLIVKFGHALKHSLRNSDFIARLGGDEFCVLFPYTPLERAQELAERLRSKLPASVELIPGVTQKLAWSGGLSEYHRDDHGENEALARADAALLDAKRDGRNVTRVKAAA